MVESEKNSSEELKKRIRKRNRGKKNDQQKVEEETLNVEENVDDVQKKSETNVKKVNLQARGKVEEKVEEEAMEEGEEEKNIVVVGKGIMTNETFESLPLSEHTFGAIKEMGFQHMTQVCIIFQLSSHVLTGFGKIGSLWQSMFLRLFLIFWYHLDSSWIYSSPFGGKRCSWSCQDWFW